ncbi:hypothetical protein BRADI_2g50080v3 [Brachypodium distachyon]|uniref:Enoyl reductase (ER) domain-containing protein n=1 Tax=Brachypodium distachyon TaxID=15368 RepID=A0A0Q3JBZ8_BRADI|nr:hypothetical protein BRADI_2g50080v3 [Brachypodium distachyon]
MWWRAVARARRRVAGARPVSTAAGAEKSSRAVLVPRFGGPEVLELRQGVPVPDLKPGEVLVRARAVSINPLDLREASAIPFAALTAWRALHGTAGISEGQRVLVIGGGGAVGLSAVQLAVAAGCSVSATCGAQSIEQVLAAGAEKAIDYTSEDTESAVTGKFDAVLDTIGVPETERIGINLLRRGGHYMTLQGEAAALADRYGLYVGLPAATATLLKKQMQYRCSHGIEYWWTYMRADPEGLHEIRRLSGAGKLQIPVEKTFPISQVREAHEAKEKKLVPGKVVLEFD